MSRYLNKARKALSSIARTNDSVLTIAKAVDRTARQIHHGVAEVFPAVLRPAPLQLTIAVTSFCNLRCIGCNYGRGFMDGKQLSWSALKGALDDTKWAGIAKVRFYGGEPLLHPDIVRAVEYAASNGLTPYITTNGILLHQKIDALYSAGLRLVTVGFYGDEKDYDSYTQRPGRYRLLEKSFSYVRSHYGPDLEMQLNYVLLKPSCSVEAVNDAWTFAQRFGMHLHVDLGGETIPFFNPGDGGSLIFSEGDRPALMAVASRLLELKRAYPGLVAHSGAFLASIPDWMILGRHMQVACDAYQLVWIGADGSVQLCDVTFPLGNINTTPLRDILFSSSHDTAARRAFKLDCPNCTCKAETRIQTNFRSHRKYAAKARTMGTTKSSSI
jgi:cyclic pyranopterin phosphate synthase